MTRRDARRMIQTVTTRHYSELSKVAQNGSTQESRYFRDRGKMRSMQMQMQRRRI